MNQTSQKITAATKNENPAEIIKQIIETTLSKLGIVAAVEFFENIEEIKFIIKTQEGGILIGENGKNLFALNHIVKRMSEHILSEQNRISFSVDINDYQAKKIEELRAIARISAQRVRYFKKPVSMKPMSAYERRIIHTTLLEYPDIATESIGQEPKRQVVIRPYS